MSYLTRKVYFISIVIVAVVILALMSQRIIFDQSVAINFKQIITSKSVEKNVSNKPTIFCLIKTHPDNIKIKKALNVYKIWGRKCDNYRFVTLIPTELIPKNTNKDETFEVYNQFYMIQPKNLKTETHARLTLKVYYAIIYVYEKFPNYDWYHIVDDDAYVNIENYKKFLKQKDPKNPITFGYNIKLFVPNGGYHSGGPGFGVSNEAFIRIGKALKENINNCPDSGIDDVDINACVRKYGGAIGSSCDDEGKERFIVLGIKDHIMGNFPNWVINYANCKTLKGIDCCSDSFIAVHYVQPKDVFRLDMAIEMHKNFVNNYNNQENINKNGSLPVKFRDIARTYLMLEDMEMGTNIYQKFMNITT